MRWHGLDAFHQVWTPFRRFPIIQRINQFRLSPNCGAKKKVRCIVKMEVSVLQNHPWCMTKLSKQMFFIMVRQLKLKFMLTLNLEENWKFKDRIRAAGVVVISCNRYWIKFHFINIIILSNNHDGSSLNPIVDTSIDHISISYFIYIFRRAQTLQCQVMFFQRC